MTHISLIDDRPSLTSDELFALTVLSDRGPLSESDWREAMTEMRGDRARKRFHDWLRALLADGYVRFTDHGRRFSAEEYLEHPEKFVVRYEVTQTGRGVLRTPLSTQARCDP